MLFRNFALAVILGLGAYVAASDATKESNDKNAQTLADGDQPEAMGNDSDTQFSAIPTIEAVIPTIHPFCDEGKNFADDSDKPGDRVSPNFSFDAHCMAERPSADNPLHMQEEQSSKEITHFEELPRHYIDEFRSKYFRSPMPMRLKFLANCPARILFEVLSKLSFPFLKSVSIDVDGMLAKFQTENSMICFINSEAERDLKWFISNLMHALQIKIKLRLYDIWRLNISGHQGPDSGRPNSAPFYGSICLLHLPSDVLNIILSMAIKDEMAEISSDFLNGASPNDFSVFHHLVTVYDKLNQSSSVVSFSPSFYLLERQRIILEKLRRRHTVCKEFDYKLSSKYMIQAKIDFLIELFIPSGDSMLENLKVQTLAIKSYRMDHSSFIRNMITGSANVPIEKFIMHDSGNRSMLPEFERKNVPSPRLSIVDQESPSQSADSAIMNRPGTENSGQKNVRDPSSSSPLFQPGFFTSNSKKTSEPALAKNAPFGFSNSSTIILSEFFGRNRPLISFSEVTRSEKIELVLDFVEEKAIAYDFKLRAELFEYLNLFGQVELFFNFYGNVKNFGVIFPQKFKGVISRIRINFFNGGRHILQTEVIQRCVSLTYAAFENIDASAMVVTIVVGPESRNFRYSSKDEILDRLEGAIKSDNLMADGSFADASLAILPVSTPNMTLELIDFGLLQHLERNIFHSLFSSLIIADSSLIDPNNCLSLKWLHDALSHGHFLRKIQFKFSSGALFRNQHSDIVDSLIELPNLNQVEVILETGIISEEISEAYQDFDLYNDDKIIKITEKSLTITKKAN